MKSICGLLLVFIALTSAADSYDNESYGGYGSKGGTKGGVKGGSSTIETCISTNEYNPVCGTDGITYANPSALICEARRKPGLREDYKGRCSTYKPSTSTRRRPSTTRGYDWVTRRTTRTTYNPEVTIGPSWGTTKFIHVRPTPTRPTSPTRQTRPTRPSYPGSYGGSSGNGNSNKETVDSGSSNRGSSGYDNSNRGSPDSDNSKDAEFIGNGEGSNGGLFGKGSYGGNSGAYGSKGGYSKGGYPGY